MSQVMTDAGEKLKAHQEWKRRNGMPTAAELREAKERAQTARAERLSRVGRRTTGSGSGGGGAAAAAAAAARPPTAPRGSPRVQWGGGGGGGGAGHSGAATARAHAVIHGGIGGAAPPASARALLNVRDAALHPSFRAAQQEQRRAASARGRPRAGAWLPVAST